MEQRLREDLKQAQLRKDEVTVSTLRLVLSELTYAKVAKHVDNLTDEDIISIIQKEVKKRKESIEFYIKGNRVDLAQKESDELEILQIFLPNQISDEELTKIVEDSITRLGASSKADMGKVIGLVMSKVGQRAEGARVSGLVRQKLTI